MTSPTPQPDSARPDTGMRRHALAAVLIVAYRLLGGRKRKHVGARLLRLICRIEGGPHYSRTAREIMRRFHGVQIGAYSRSACFDPTMYAGPTILGRYCSIAAGIRIYDRNHPIDRLSTHALFYDPNLKLTSKLELPPAEPLKIGNDVWIGARAVILPGCRVIGDGAVIGAGAMVTKNVPAFAVVVGNPGRVVRSRFSDATIARLEQTRWWDRPLAELIADPGAMTQVVGEDGAHPLIQSLLAKGFAGGEPDDPASRVDVAAHEAGVETAQ